MSDSEADCLLDNADYYGKKDFRPLTGCKKVCAYIAGIIFSPVLLLVSLIVAAFLCCLPMSKGQQGTFKMMLFEMFYKAPGVRLLLKPSGKDISDVIIPDDFVDDDGLLNACGGLGLSLRKSIEVTVTEHIQNGPHGANVAADTDPNKARYFVNGGVFEWNAAWEERWGGWARFLDWAAVYSWSSYFPVGMGCAGMTQALDLEDAPDVLGYIFFFEIGNQKFYETDRIVKVKGQVMNCPEITPENEGKIFLRYGYKKGIFFKQEFGNLDADDPDAFMFKGQAVKDAQFKLLHMYRIMKPAACSE